MLLRIEITCSIVCTHRIQKSKEENSRQEVNLALVGLTAALLIAIFKLWTRVEGTRSGKVILSLILVSY